jgi:carbonic anhydrase
LGDIFSIRFAGNILNYDILGSMEYACNFAKSKIIVVLGHTNCGAIISACNNLKIGHLTSLEGNKVIKDDQRILLNFSTIEDGCICDLIADLFDKNGIENYLIKIG